MKCSIVVNLVFWGLVLRMSSQPKDVAASITRVSVSGGIVVWRYVSVCILKSSQQGRDTTRTGLVEDSFWATSMARGTSEPVAIMVTVSAASAADTNITASSSFPSSPPAVAPATATGSYRTSSYPPLKTSSSLGVLGSGAMFCLEKIKAQGPSFLFTAAAYE